MNRTNKPFSFSRGIAVVLATIGLWVLGANAASIPSFVNWDLAGAEQRANAQRAEITLNGWWRWQPAGAETVPPMDGWLYRKVPGFGRGFYVRDDRGERVKVWNGEPITGEETCWQEREVTVPRAWAGRQVYLEIDAVVGEESVVFLDGEKIGIMGANAPYAFPLPKPYPVDRPYRVSMLSGGIVHNVWLRSYPGTGVRVEDAYLTTSVREMKVGLTASGHGASVSGVRVLISTDPDLSDLVKEAGPFQVTAGGTEGDWQLEAAFSWEDPQLWSLEQPNLYHYALQVVGSDGTVLDQTLPVRFGFREFWIEGGDFYLNGVRTLLRGDSNVPFTHRAVGSHTRMGVLGHETYMRNAFRAWKKLGLNSCTVFGHDRLNGELLYRVADEEGYLIQRVMSGVSLSRDAEAADDPKVRNYLERRLEGFVKPVRNHPSLGFYFISSGSVVWDYYSDKVGAPYDDVEIWGRGREAGEREAIQALDPQRAVTDYSRGGVHNPVHASMAYMNFDLDLQSQEDWPYAWSKHRRVPVLPTEVSFVYHSAWAARPTRSSHARAGSRPFLLEYSAIYLGDEAYRMEPEEHLREAVTRLAEKRYPVSAPSFVSSRRTKMLIARNLLRAWRTYGISFALHAEVRTFYENLAKPEPLDVDPRRSTYVADEIVTEGDPSPDSRLNEVGQVVHDVMQPLLAYIGGPDGAFTTKDHVFYPGETVRKAVVVLNDYETPVELTGRWWLEDETGKTVKEETFGPLSMPAGSVNNQAVEIEFNAPQSTERKRFTIGVELKANRPGTLTDRFALTVLPAPPRLAAERKFVLFDPVGDTEAMLSAAGIPFEKVGAALPNTDSVLIIGRNALQSTESIQQLGSLHTDALSYGFDVAVEGGLRVIVFEQATENLLGLRSEEMRWRQAFLTAKGHPVLQGLEDSDFNHFRGESDLTEAWPDSGPPPVVRNAHPLRFPRWSQRNTVVTYPIVRPQVGAARSLVSCGFALSESALLETVRGKGRMIFCQMDVTSRYGRDPAATRLVNNLLSYMSTTRDPDPTIGEPVNVTRMPDYLPMGWKLTEQDVFRVDEQEGPLTWGIMAADLYWGEMVNLPFIQNEKGQLLMYTPVPGERTVAHSLNLRSFTTQWQRARALKVLAALRINQGGSSSDGPALGLHGDAETLYPIMWLEGFVHPYDHHRW